MTLTVRHRCFLYLVNYARMKPEVALKALPILVAVGQVFRGCTLQQTD